MSFVDGTGDFEVHAHRQLRPVRVTGASAAACLSHESSADKDAQCGLDLSSLAFPDRHVAFLSTPVGKKSDFHRYDSHPSAVIASKDAQQSVPSSLPATAPKAMTGAVTGLPDSYGPSPRGLDSARVTSARTSSSKSSHPALRIRVIDSASEETEPSEEVTRTTMDRDVTRVVSDLESHSAEDLSPLSKLTSSKPQAFFQQRGKGNSSATGVAVPTCSTSPVQVTSSIQSSVRPSFRATTQRPKSPSVYSSVPPCRSPMTTAGLETALSTSTVKLFAKPAVKSRQAESVGYADGPPRLSSDESWASPAILKTAPRSPISALDRPSSSSLARSQLSSATSKRRVQNVESDGGKVSGWNPGDVGKSPTTSTEASQQLLRSYFSTFPRSTFESINPTAPPVISRDSTSPMELSEADGAKPGTSLNTGGSPTLGSRYVTSPLADTAQGRRITKSVLSSSLQRRTESLTPLAALGKHPYFARRFQPAPASDKPPSSLQ